MKRDLFVKSKRVFLGMVSLVFSGAVEAQTHRENDNMRTWVAYFGDHKLKKRFGFHFDAQQRSGWIGPHSQQTLLRPGLNVYLGKKAFVTAGYAYIATHAPSGAELRWHPEHRVFQQLQVMDRVRSIPMTHRFRLEQRFLGVLGTGGVAHWRYQNRARYFFRTELPLLGRRAFRRGFYTAFYDEILLQFGANKGASVYDQNRFYAGIGRRLGKSNKLELGYIYQNHLQRDGRTQDRNHAVSLMFLSTASR